MSNEFIRQNSERFAKMFEFALEDNNSKSDKQASTEYTGVYTAIFPNKTPRELELEEIIKNLHYELTHLKMGDTNIPHLFGKSFEEIAKILSQYGKFKQSESCVKELEEENKLLKSQLNVALASLVLIRDASRDLYSSRRATQILQKIRQMEQEAKALQKMEKENETNRK